MTYWLIIVTTDCQVLVELWYTHDMELEAFEAVINEAVGMVPKHIRAKMENVAFVVDDQHLGNLLGLYHGIPLTRRGPGYSGVLPDKITIFQRTIEATAGADSERLRKLIIEVVHHEIAHYFGFSESEVRKWERGRAQRKKS